MKLEKLKESVRIVDFARSLGLSPKKIGSRYYTLKEHDSVRIDPVRNIFIRNSTGEKGSIIDFAMAFTSCTTVREAIKMLEAEADVTVKANSVSVKEIDKRDLVLPVKDDNMRNIFAYLIKQRCIDKDIVTELVKSRKLYQDEHKNCVFVSPSRDDPKFVTLRGTNTNYRFVGDVAGSDYKECFFIKNENAKFLIVTESVIDALSIMTLFKRKNMKYENCDYLALCGTDKYEQSLNHHMTNKEYKEIILCLDNDNGGLSAMDRIENFLGDRNVIVTKNPPPACKDYNELLQLLSLKGNGGSLWERELNV